MTGTMIGNEDVGEKEIGTETGIETAIDIALEKKKNMAEIGIEKGIGKVGSGKDEIGTVAGGGAIRGAEVGVGIARIVMEIIERDMPEAASALGDEMDPRTTDIEKSRRRKRKRRRRRMMELIIQIQKLQKPTGFEHHLV